LKYQAGQLLNLPCRRAPLGARGLKFCVHIVLARVAASRSARSAWIEIATTGASRERVIRRAPLGARGLKSA